MIYEYRVYTVAPGCLEKLHTRFRDSCLAFFEKYQMKQIGFFTPTIGGVSNQLIYVLAFENIEQRNNSWETLNNDKDWQKIKKESELGGPLVSEVRNMILEPTDYSLLQ